MKVELFTGVAVAAISLAALAVVCIGDATRVSAARAAADEIVLRLSESPHRLEDNLIVIDRAEAMLRGEPALRRSRMVSEISREIRSAGIWLPNAHQNIRFRMRLSDPREADAARAEYAASVRQLKERLEYVRRTL